MLKNEENKSIFLSSAGLKYAFEKIPESADPRAITKWKQIGPLSIKKILDNSDLSDMGVDPNELELKRFDLEKGYCIGFYKKGMT